MVSIFGLKIGGDKKKSKEAAKPPPPRKRIDQNTLGEGQLFGRDLPRPQLPGSRPGSSASNRSPVVWNAPYSGPIGAASMVDLNVPAPGRKDSFSSLRSPQTPGSKLGMQWSNGSGVSLALPPPPGMLGARPGTPTRPGTPGSRTKEWVNPLDVHFCRDPSTSRPQTRAGYPEDQSKPNTPTPFDQAVRAAAESDPKPREYNHMANSPSFDQDGNATPGTPLKPRPNGSKSSLGQFDLAARETNTRTNGSAPSSGSNSVDEQRHGLGAHGYPSPPKSMSPLSPMEEPHLNKPNTPSALRHVDLTPVSPVEEPYYSKPNAPSTLRRVNTAERPPSPPSSTELPRGQSPVGRISDDQWDGPVIRNVQAKRDTLTHHPTKRRSFTMEVHGSEQAMHVHRDRRGSPVRDQNRQAEGMDWRPRKPQQVEGLAGNFADFDFGESVRSLPVRPPPVRSAPVSASRPESPAGSQPPPRHRREREENNKLNIPRPAGYDEVRSPGGFQESPVDPRKNDPWGNGPILNRERPRIYPERPRTAPGPSPNPPTALSPAPPPPPGRFPMGGPQQPPSHAQRRGPPRNAAGLHNGPRHEHDRPGPDGRPAPDGRPGPNGPYHARPGMAPRGFSSRDNAESHQRARAPPQPLSLRPPPSNRPERPERPERPQTSPANTSPYGPPLEDDSYMRDDDERAPAPEQFPTPPGFSRADRPLSSPFNRPPMEGDFPKSKGLPRGRRPDPLNIEQNYTGPPPQSSASSRWRQWGSPGFLSSPASSPNLQQQHDAPDHGYTLPNWDDFDISRKSAIPAPLSPMRGDAPPPPFSSTSPWSPTSSSFTSTTAPRLPSPTFPSLEKSISSSSAQLGGSFELFYDEPQEMRHQPLISPVLGNFPMPREQASRSGHRVEAQKAPPRPAPVTVPPSRDGKSPMSEAAGGMRSPALGRDFQSSFI